MNAEVTAEGDPAQGAAPTAADGRRRGAWLLAGGAVALGAFVALLPAVWAAHVEAEIRRTIAREHPQGYAVLGYHVDGVHRGRLDMYGKLWTHYTFRSEHAHGPWWYHHVALLLADDRRVYRYHWSMREDRLVLEAVADLDRVPRPQRDEYRHEPADRESADGLTWKRQCLVSDRAWEDGLWYAF